LIIIAITVMNSIRLVRYGSVGLIDARNPATAGDIRVSVLHSLRLLRRDY